MRVSCLLLAAGVAAPAAAQELPQWLRVKGSFRARFESIDQRLKRGESGSNQGLFTRTLFEVSLRDTFTEATAEMIDARVFGAPDDATTTTGQVDAAELLQGYFAAHFSGAFEPGDALRVQLGRHTMDIGSRRLVARNLFRNTANAFTGINAQWKGADGAWGRAFYTFPVQRRPADTGALLDNKVQFDQERSSVRFWGLEAGQADALAGGEVQGYVLGLFEGDAPRLATADRHLTTLGARWVRAPRRGQVNWELESAFQFGSSRSGSASTVKLDHDAYLHHASLGYTFDGETSLTAEAVFDMASGDVDPTDGENNRFDSLYGIPRQDFGPTGLFRAIARANLVSPGLRLTMTPAPGWNLMLAERFNYLASDRDAWTNGFVDPSGGSGSHLGNMTEMRLRYDVKPGGLRIEVGAAYWAAGRFAEEAPGAMGPRDALYGYVQTLVTF